jgi:hypothetical protein
VCARVHACVFMEAYVDSVTLFTFIPGGIS